MRFFVAVEWRGVGAGKDDETEGLGRLGGNPGTRSGDKEPHGASRPDKIGPDRDTAGESFPVAIAEGNVSPFCEPSEDLSGTQRQRSGRQFWRGSASSIKSRRSLTEEWRADALCLEFTEDKEHQPGTTRPKGRRRQLSRTALYAEYGW